MGDTSKYVLAKVPILAPLPYGARIRTGTLDPSTLGSFDQFDETGYLSKWAEIIHNHDEDVQKLFQTNDELKKYLPAIPPTGYPYQDNPWVKLGHLDDDDDALKEAKKVSMRSLTRALLWTLS